jgi:hypothetical protein
MFVLTSLVMILAGQAKAGPNEESIQHLLKSQFPDTSLVIEPIVVVSDHAVAGWTQGDTGGRALLRKKAGVWSLILCSGDGIKSAEALKHAGLAETDAAVLSAKLSEAERALPPARLAQFSKFEGTMMMDASGAHPPTHQH